MTTPIPRSPRTFDEFTRARLAAIERFTPLAQRLGLGELIALSEVVTDEMARRRPLLEREAAREARSDKSGIGNR